VTELPTQQVEVNMGPHHPSTHGVFRMKMVLDGEVVVGCEPVMGYLHRSVEKLGEERTYHQNIGFTDRLDYLAAMSNNLAYVLAAEKLAGIPVPPRAQYLRTIFAELQRIASHAMAIGTFINDCGTWHTPLLYLFREREKILDLFEMTCGARLTTSYMRIGGVSQDIPEEFVPALRSLLDEMPQRIDEYEQLILENEIFLSRTKRVGILPKDLAISASASGPVLRGSGVAWDLRKTDPYCCYDEFEFDVPVGEIGDCFDRFWVRLREVRQSVRIIEQALEQLPSGDVRTKTDLWLKPPVGEAYGHIESPKGELGYYLLSDGGVAPYRFKIRSPSFINVTTLRDMMIGHKVADAVVILGSLDIVLGEVDR
jgi:NADH-quinone oxidoreductase subunit D